MLKDLLVGVSSWKKLEEQISSLETVNERGEVFEEFCKAYFELNPVYQTKKVHRKIPPSIAAKLGHPGRKDIGIDGVIETKNDEIYAYQAKFRQDRNNTPTWSELATFYGISDKADYRFIITNANNIPKQVNDRIKQGRITAGDLERLDKDFFVRLRKFVLENIVAIPKRLKPHQTQNEVIQAGVKYFAENERGKLVLPCGTGKTLASLWLTEHIGAKNILVMVPSLALMRQTLKEWSEQSNEKFSYLCLCSDVSVEGTDSIIENTYEMDVRVSTDIDEVSKFLNRKINTKKVLFSTYQSSKVLSDATLKTKTRFDIGIFDEAHRTTGTKTGVWNIAIDDKKVPIKKRLFMTATPRIYAPHITKKAKEHDILLYSMDDSETYGETFYEMTFGNAIKKNLITDYNIIVIVCTEPEVREFIENNNIIVDSNDKEWDSKAFAKRIAISKAINKQKLKKIFTFHNTVNGAKAFTESPVYGIKSVYEGMNFRDNSKFESFHVNGTMNSGMRAGLMNEFIGSEIGIMSNARCLVEGVDVPIVNAIGFIDPKRSLIDIVQATGRALRKAKWKDKGYIFLPVFLEDADNADEAIERTEFNVVWQVINAMSDQDERLESMI